MTDKIEIPEEVKLIVKDYYEYKQKESTINNVGPVYEFLNDIIQKQDNKIGVGDWYHTEIINNSKMKDSDLLYFYYCEDEGEAVRASTNSECKKAPKELIAGLEKLRNG